MKKKEAIGKEKHPKVFGMKKVHIAKKKSPHGLIIFIFSLVLFGLIVLPVLIQEIKVGVPESIPFIKPSPPEEPEEGLVEVFIEEEAEKPAEKPLTKKTLKERVSIQRYSLEPDNLVIEEGTLVSWVNDDTRQHKIVCYINSRRILVGESLDKGEKTSYNFKDSGEYMCIDAVFGSRMKIIVEPMTLLRITGGSVKDIPTENIVLAGLLAFVILMAISIYLYANKKI